MGFGLVGTGNGWGAGTIAHPLIDKDPSASITSIESFAILMTPSIRLFKQILSAFLEQKA